MKKECTQNSWKKGKKVCQNEDSSMVKQITRQDDGWRKGNKLVLVKPRNIAQHVLKYQHGMVCHGTISYVLRDIWNREVQLHKFKLGRNY